MIDVQVTVISVCEGVESSKLLQRRHSRTSSVGTANPRLFENKNNIVPNNVHPSKIEHSHAKSIPNGTVICERLSSPQKPKRTVSWVWTIKTEQRASNFTLLKLKSWGSYKKFFFLSVGPFLSFSCRAYGRFFYSYFIFVDCIVIQLIWTMSFKTQVMNAFYIASNIATKKKKKRTWLKQKLDFN